jgi:hypothetical protein
MNAGNIAGEIDAALLKPMAESPRVNALPGPRMLLSQSQGRTTCRVHVMPATGAACEEPVTEVPPASAELPFQRGHGQVTVRTARAP